MKAWFTPPELAGLPGMPKTAPGVRHRAQVEHWSGRPRNLGSGPKGHEYALDSLPGETRLYLATANASHATTAQHTEVLDLVKAQSAGEKVRAARKAVDRTEGTAQAANVIGPRAAERDDKLRVLVCLTRFRTGFGGPLCPAVEAFCTAWNAGHIDAPASARARYPQLPRWRTVLEWHQALENHGGAGLTRPPRADAGEYSVLQGELGQAVLALLHDKPHLGGAQIQRLLQNAGFEGLPSVWAFRRAINHWKKEKAQLFSLVTSPDKWRSRHMSAAGSRSEGVTGVNDLWEQDGTKGELMLADGKRWMLTGTIDVYTRRLMIRLSTSARAAVVMSLTRQAIAEWGVPRAIKTDNGADYVARQYELALVQLGIDHRLCVPFQPQQKPHIERAIGTLLHDLFELLPGYLGHNVAQRQDIEARKSFAERLMKGSDDGGPVELRLTPEQLQTIIDNWLSQYHEREHGGLAGMSPNAVLAAWTGGTLVVNERALDIFLEPASEHGLRTVTKKGIKIDHGWFNCAEIGGLEGQQVQVKQTDADLGTCYVFDLAGNYVGTAIDHARKGISAAEVAAERTAHQKQVLAQQKAELKAAVKAVKPQDLVMRALQRKADAAVDASPNVTRLRPTTQHTSEAIDSVVQATAVPASTLSPAAATELLRLESAAASPKAPVLDLTTPRSRYSKAVRLQARMAAGEAIDPHDLKWLDGYVTRSPEFRGLDRLHHGTDPLAAEAGT